MTKEQEAIEILNKFKNNEMQRDKLEISRYGGWKIGDIYKHLELNPAIATVLSMLKEKDKEIERLEKQSKNLDKQAQQYFEQTIYLDKQINLMAEFIARGDIEEDICVKTGRLNKCDSMAFGECENCIKQYFERKANNG